jgi:hypothetical protein
MVNCLKDDKHRVPIEKNLTPQPADMTWISVNVPRLVLFTAESYGITKPDMGQMMESALVRECVFRQRRNNDVKNAMSGLVDNFDPLKNRGGHP